MFRFSNLLGHMHAYIRIPIYNTCWEVFFVFSGGGLFTKFCFCFKCLIFYEFLGDYAVIASFIINRFVLSHSPVLSLSFFRSLHHLFTFGSYYFRLFLFCFFFFFVRIAARALHNAMFIINNKKNIVGMSASARLYF